MSVSHEPPENIAAAKAINGKWRKDDGSAGTWFATFRSQSSIHYRLVVTGTKSAKEFKEVGSQIGQYLAREILPNRNR